jgi:hypothetical protein
MTRQLPEELGARARLLMERDDLSCLVGQLESLPPEAVRALSEFVRVTKGRRR